MRAKLTEVQNFKRGRTPHEQLGIGEGRLNWFVILTWPDGNDGKKEWDIWNENNIPLNRMEADKSEKELWDHLQTRVHRTSMSQKEYDEIESHIISIKEYKEKLERSGDDSSFLDQYINENISFKRGQDPYDKLDIGNDRYTSGTYVSKIMSNVPAYHIVFPKVNKSARINFAFVDDQNRTVLTNIPENATNASLSWYSFFDEDNETNEIKEILYQYFLDNADELIKNAKDLTRDEYNKIIDSIDI